MDPMTIHSEDPFATPDDQRSPVRRFRGRLPSPVTVWTAGSGAERAGLTVSSLLVADGEPGRLAGVINDESEVWTAIQDTGRFAVIRLGADDRQVADRFAAALPAPGGPFRTGTWRQTDYGPVPGDGTAASRTWAGCRFDAARPYGWGLLVEAIIEEIEFVPSTDALVHLSGRYRDISNG
jgi:flavin reductase (DIM6/NTAB) family NADH-FMN oxidoreductase RutF